MVLGRAVAGGLALLLTSLVGVVAAGPAQADDAPSPLPWSSFSHILADPHGHVLLTGGPGADGIWVRAADGSADRTVAGMPGAQDMVLSADGGTVYVALSDGASIAAISTTTLAETHRYPTPGACPSDLAVVGATVWFSTACGDQGRLGVVDLADGHVAYPTDPVPGGVLVSSPAYPTSLVVTTEGSGPAQVYRYTVSGTTLTQVAYHWGGDTGLGILRSMVVEPDGEHLVIAAGAPYHGVRLRLSDLNPAGTYEADAYPVAVAVSPAHGGTVVVGLMAWDSPTIWVHAGGTLVQKLTLPDVTADDGLALSPDGGRLYVVTGMRGGTSFALRVVSDPTQTPTTLTLTGPTTAPRQSAVTLSGRLATEAGGVAGASLTVTRTDASGSATLSPATTGGDGSFTIVDTVGTSTATYAVSYAGDGTRAPSAASATVDVAKDGTAIALSSPTSASRGSAYTLSGRLTGPRGAPVAGAAVTLRRHDLAGVRTLTALTSSSGAFALRDVPAVGGPVTWTASFAGDASTSGSRGTRTVTVARAATRLTVAPSRKAYAYGSRATLRITLSRTFNNRVVLVYAQPLGPGPAPTWPGTLVGRATVNAKGRATVTYRMLARTTLTVRFAGDYRYAPASRAVRPDVTTSVPLQAVGYVAKKGSAYVFRGTAHFRATTRPGRYVGCMKYVAQQYYQRRWVTVATLPCASIQDDLYSYVRTDPGRAGALLRIRVTVGRSPYSLGGASAWLRFRFA